MVVGWNDCHSSVWTTAYSGYLMADYDANHGVKSDPICVDDSPDVTFETRIVKSGLSLNFIRSGKGFWYQNQPIPCAVCIKEVKKAL